jgi:hypothetical protein
MLLVLAAGWMLGAGWNSGADDDDDDDVVVVMAMSDGKAGNALVAEFRPALGEMFAHHGVEFGGAELPGIWDLGVCLHKTGRAGLCQLNC